MIAPGFVPKIRTDFHSPSPNALCLNCSAHEPVQPIDFFGLSPYPSPELVEERKTFRQAPNAPSAIHDKIID